MVAVFAAAASATAFAISPAAIAASVLAVLHSPSDVVDAALAAASATAEAVTASTHAGCLQGYFHWEFFRSLHLPPSLSPD
jgi:hypothetical protein